MIRKHLQAEKFATSAIFMQHPDSPGLVHSAATGFFVSKDGWFITAAHVMARHDNPRVRNPHADHSLLCQVTRFGKERNASEWGRLVEFEPDLDFALLKAHAGPGAPIPADGIDFLPITTFMVEEASPVFSFGYPLSGATFISVRMPEGGPRPDASPVFQYKTDLKPRVTSAIVASALERTHFPEVAEPVETYVLDKALNYGNSGGPVIHAETGNVFAFCSRFQPVQILQQPAPGGPWGPFPIEIPSLYGIAVSLADKRIRAILKKHGIPIIEPPAYRPGA